MLRKQHLSCSNLITEIPVLACEMQQNNLPFPGPSASVKTGEVDPHHSLARRANKER